MRRLALVIAIVTVLGALPAEALTVREIVELSRAGLSEDVLLALIEIEAKVFPVDADTVKTLKAGGVSERVIAAMVRHGRSKPFEAPAPAAVPEAAPQPQVVVIDHEVERVREVPVVVPVYVPIHVRVPRVVSDVRHVPVEVQVPSSIGLAHGGRIGLSPAPPRPTSDPPYWQYMVPLPRRSDPPYWRPGR